MKLRNKQTGEIKECIVLPIDESGYPNEYQVFEKGNSLAELNEEWEDYEEPKEHWHIRDCEVYRSEIKPCIKTEKRKSIGNYFETKEEAEQAVEKLKAWKRLKDKGFEFTNWKFTPDMKHIKGNFITIKAEIPYIVENQADLDLLFGGEE